MITDKHIPIRLTINNKNHIESKGYIFTGSGNVIDIKIIDLNENSHRYVNVKCDYCGRIVEKEYRSVLKQRKNFPKDACKECRNKKQRDVTQKLYRVDNVSQIDGVQDKIKKTNLERYGNEVYFRSNDCKEKSKNTCLDKYGVGNYTQTEEYRSKVTITNLNKYGVEHVSQAEEIKEKVKKTNMDRYGFPVALKSPEILLKTRETNLKKYGVEWAALSSEVIAKRKKTVFERYGVEYITQSKEFMEKSRKTLAENGTVPTSSQQIEIYNMMKENNYSVKINHPISSVNLDVAFFIDNFKIDIEYDGWYWHKNKQVEDRKRDEFLKSQGWKVLRIKSYREIPRIEQILESIEKLITTTRTYTEIVMDDIKLRSDAN